MSKNSKLFRVGTCESVNLETGETIPVEDGGLRMLPGPRGSCEWCHIVHDPSEPHDKQSLAYAIKFQTLYGRSPTWSDSMQHCSPEVQSQWRQTLVEVMEEKGIEIPEDLRS